MEKTYICPFCGKKYSDPQAVTDCVNKCQAKIAEAEKREREKQKALAESLKKEAFEREKKVLIEKAEHTKSVIDTKSKELTNLIEEYNKMVNEAAFKYGVSLGYCAHSHSSTFVCPTEKSIDSLSVDLSLFDNPIELSLKELIDLL